MGFEDLTQEDLYSFDVLVHLACDNIIYSQDHCLESFKTNAFNTFMLFKKFKGKIIYTSTCSVYGQSDVIPTPEDAEIRVNGVYDQSKYLSEMYLQFRGNQTTLRLSNVYGRNQRPDHVFSGVIGKLIGNALKKKPFTIIGDGKATRDYTYIDDVIEAIVKAINLSPIECAVNIATGKEANAIVLASIISELTGCEYRLRRIQERSIDTINRRCLDISLAKRLLDWEPKTELYNGIARTIKEYE